MRRTFGGRTPYHKDDIRHPRHNQPGKKKGGSTADIKKMAAAATKRVRQRTKNKHACMMGAIKLHKPFQ